MNKSRSKFVISDNITFKYAKGISDKSGKEFHTYHEIIYFMGGKANFISENIQTPLKPNTLIVLPAETYHQLLITGSQEDYERCVFHFLNPKELHDLIATSMNGIRILEINSRFHYLFHQMISLTDSSQSEQMKDTIMRAVLTLILSEISSSTKDLHDKDVPDTLSDKCIAFITEHIGESLSVGDIAKELNLSVSYLSHTFKKQMNISLHQYILKKRLVMAHHKILDGEPATKAAIDCGFNDYSGFYKQFKKMFDKSPSSKASDMA